MNSNSIKALNFIAAGQWAMRRESFEAMINSFFNGTDDSIFEISEQQKDISSYQIGDPIDGTVSAWKKDRLGFLLINGPLIPYRDSFLNWLGYKSISDLTGDFDVLEKDRSVDTIVLLLDTPGGNVVRISEFADQIFKSKKETIAHIVGDADSAGYWIASQTNKITSVDTGVSGSIGVVTTIVDYSEAVAKKGIKVFDVVSSQSPRKRTDLNTEEGRTELQAVLDGIADVFIDTVANGRSIDREKVESDFGQGGYFVAKDALERGLIDEIISTSDLIKALEEKKELALYGSNVQNIKKEVSIMDAKEKKELEEKTALEKDQAVKAEQERIRSIESIKDDFKDAHLEVKEAIAKIVDTEKFKSESTIEKVKLMCSQAAYELQNKIIDSMRAVREALAEDLSDLPDRKEGSDQGGEVETVDKEKVKRIAAGIESIRH